MVSMQVLFAACMLQLVSAEQPICAQWGVPLDDGHRNSWPPNGGNTTDSSACQVKCQSALFCEHFTWYANTGGCWLQGDNVTEIHNVYAPLAISGPRVCISSRDIRLGSTISATSSSSSATQSVQQIVAVVLAILLVVLLLAGAYYWFCHRTKSERSKRGIQIASHSSQDVEDQSPLMSNNAPPQAKQIQQFAPVVQAAPFVGSLPQAAPVYQQAMTRVQAAPVVGFLPQAAPVYQQAITRVQAAPVVGFLPQAAPVYQQAMTRFDMLDTDHSGGISREEFERAFK